MFLTRSGTNWEDGLRPEILDLGSRGIIVLYRKNKGSDQLHSNHAADLLFRICKKAGFLMTQLLKWL